MCGLLGGFFRDKCQSTISRFEQALSKIHHRGPDDRGYETFDINGRGVLALGHTRLSILDLSTSGHQPMTSHDGKLTIVYNGEVYNYKEIRKELINFGYEFRTETDTEVVLYAFQHWDVGCLTKFKGMFSFCIYDSEKNKIYLVRDAFGIKPLFYIIKNDRLIFSSEINPILDLLEEKPEPDFQVAYNYIVHSDYDSTEDTFFREIKRVPPATYIECDLYSFKLSRPYRWWLPKTEENVSISFDDAVHKVRNEFIDNVRFHLRSDVPIGAALSGGIDSSAIVCVMRYLEPDIPIHTFSYIAGDSSKSEEKWVDLVNQHTNAIGHKVEAAPDELMLDLDDLIKSQGEPFSTTSIYAQYRVFQLASKNGIKVTLDGQGADELLAGYSAYPGERLMSLIENKSYITALLFSYKWSQWPGRKYIQSWMYLGRKLLPDFIYKKTRRIIGRNFEPKWLNTELLLSRKVNLQENRMLHNKKFKGRRLIEQLSFQIHNRGLQSLLRHGDRNSMRFSVESRVPFLTTDYADYLFGLPENYLVSNNGESKHIFRVAMRGLVPKEILDRRDKIGFDTDDANWKEFYLNEIRKSNIKNLSNFINISEFLDEEKNVNEKVCWRVMNYIKWYNAYF